LRILLPADRFLPVTDRSQQANWHKRKVLVVSPRFPPKNAADLHRVRMSLPWYRASGWEPHVLCVDSATADCVDDPMLAEALPQDIRIVRVHAWKEEKCRRFGFGELSYRSLLPLYRAGCKLLQREKFDVVFFSTTVFLCFVLGPLWKRRFGCRIVYDFQDPWYNEPSRRSRDVPGKRWKYRLDQTVARYLEWFALKSADHIVVVSAGYVRALLRRYSWLHESDFTILPFGAAANDYDFVRRHAITQSVFEPGQGVTRWIYAGAVVGTMEPVLKVFFNTLAELMLREPQLANTLRVHFVGTSYATAKRATKRVEPLLAEFHLEEIVREHPLRIPYFETLALYADSDAVLLFGTPSPDYTASKLFSCILAKKPILALFHRDSLVAKIAPKFPNVFLASFENSPFEPEFRSQVVKGIEWLRAAIFDSAAIDVQLDPWSAEETTRIQCDIFERVSTPGPSMAIPKVGAHTPT
jgi:hypothetical protein